MADTVGADPVDQDESTVWSIAPIRGALDHNSLADVLDLLATAGEADGSRALSDQSLLTLRHGPDNAIETFLAYAHAPARISARQNADSPEAGKPVESLAGIAVVTDSADPTLELVVHPHYRQQGLGRALAEAAVSTLSHDGLVDAAALHAWAHGDSPASAALAESSGFTPVRKLIKMERPADVPLDPPGQLPGGLRLRTFDPARDVDAWVRSNSVIFADHPEQGRLTSDDVRARMDEAWFASEDFLLVVDDSDTILGFNWLKRTADEAEIYAIGVMPQAQGLGLGGFLTREGIRRLQSGGPRAVELYTEADNVRAVALYSGLGFEQAAADVMYALRERRR